MEDNKNDFQGRPWIKTLNHGSVSTEDLGASFSIEVAEKGKAIQLTEK